MSSRSRFRSTSRQLALEPRLLFDAGAPAAIDQAFESQSELFDPAADTHTPAEEASTAAPASTFSLDVATANIQNAATALQPEGSISSIQNTSADGTMTVGEDDPSATLVLADWEVKGSGEITVTVTGQSDGLGALTHPATQKDGQGAFTFTGNAQDVNAWLKQFQYQYTQDPAQQKQTGDSYQIALTFTTYNQEGTATTTTKTQQVDIAPQNDAPTLQQSNIKDTPIHIGQALEDGRFEFGAAQDNVEGNPHLGFTHAALGLSDPDNSAKQVILKLESLPQLTEGGPAIGTLQLNGVTLAAGSTLSAADLKNLVYVHNGDQVLARGTYVQFQFTIDDGAGGRLSTQSFAIELIPVNQAPSVSGSVTIIEGEKNISLGLGGKLPVLAGGTMDRGQIVGVDPDDQQLTYTITALPQYGQLFYQGTLITTDNMGSVVINDLTELTYTYAQGVEPKSHGGVDKLSLVAKDQGGGTGNALQSTKPIEIQLTILDNNDDPFFYDTTDNSAEKPENKRPMELPAANADGSITLSTQDYRTQPLPAGNVVKITVDMLPLADSDSFAANRVFTITGSNASDSGYFTVNGKLLDATETQRSTFTYQDVLDGQVQYHFVAAGASREDHVDFTVTDSGTTIDFNKLGTDGQPTVREGGIYTPSGELQVFRLSFLTPESTGGAGKLPPMPDQPQEWKQEGDGTFVLLESQGSGEGNEAKRYVLTAADLHAVDGVNTLPGIDPITDPAPEKVVYTITSAVTSGTFYLKNEDGTYTALQQFGTFTQKDVNTGKVSFAHAGGEVFLESFNYSVSNGDTSTASTSTFHIQATPQNDTPTASQKASLNVLEGGTIAINGAGLQHIVLSDADQTSTEGGYANSNELWFVVTKLPEYGELLLNDSKVNVGDKVTQAQLNAGLLTYKHHGSEQFTDSFEIQPYDNQKVGTGEPDGTVTTDTNQSSMGQPVEIKITIAPDNDAPQLQSKLQLNGGTGVAREGLYEGDTATIWGNDLTAANAAGKPYGQLVYTDQDNTDPQQIQYRLTESTQYGQLVLKQADGRVTVLVKNSTFTQDDLNNGRIEYRHNGGENHTDTFHYLVSDGDHSVNDTTVNGDRQPGETVNATPASTFSIHVKPSNDKPSIVQKPSKPVVVDGSDSGVNKAPGFKVGDVDLPDTGTGGDIDLITVIVRVTEANGTPLTNTDYTLKVTEISGVQGNTSANGGSAGAGYLVLTGTRDNVNNALASLEVGFGSDTNAKYKLQVIADDRLNAAGNAYQNGGDGVVANGGDQNRQGKNQLEAVDSNSYDWANQNLTAVNSFNLSVASVDLWVSIDNQAPEITTTPPAFEVDEDVPTKLGSIALADAESTAFGTWVDVTLSVPEGSGTLSASNLPDGVSVVNGNGTHSLTLRGDVTTLNTFLDTTKTNDETGVFFTSAAHDNSDRNGADADGDVTLTITLNEGKSNIGTPNANGTSSGDPLNGGSAIGGDTEGGLPATDTAAPLQVTTTVAITIVAANDAPTASNSQSKPLVITDATTPKAIEGFTISDSNDADFASSGETDFIQVTVRLLDKDGKPLVQAGYSGVTLDIKDGASGIAFGGVNDVLVLRGTVAEVQAALAGLQITLQNDATGDKPGLGNADNPYKVQIIADDRLRDANGDLTAGANGGFQNNTGTGNSTSTADVPNGLVNPYTTTTADLKKDYAQNISTAELVIWPSSTNEKPVIQRDPPNVTVNEDTPTFIGGGIKVTDAESDQFGLSVEITLSVGDKGTLSVGGEGTQSGTITFTQGEKTYQVTIVSGDETGTLVLRGTASAISALLNDGPPDLHVNPGQGLGLFFTSNPDDNADHNGTDETQGQGDITVNLTINELESATAFGQEPEIVQSAFYITVNPVNDAPVINGTTNNGNFVLYPNRVDGGQSNNGWHWTTGADNHDTGANGASHAPIQLLTDATVSDVDLDAALNGTGANSFGGGTITVTLDSYADGDVLALSDMQLPGFAGFDSTLNGEKAALKINLTADATVAQVQAILNALTFDNDQDPTKAGTTTEGKTTRTYTIVLNDGNNTNAAGNNAGGTTALNSNVKSGTLTFQRYEAPVATADTAPDTLVSGGTQATAGNVLTNDTDKVHVGGNDHDGKDDLKVTQIQSAGSSTPVQPVSSGAPTTVVGTYGTLTIQHDGSYTYTLNTESQAYKELGAETVQESFAYRITDAQGLSDDSTLTINVTGVDDPVTVNPGNTNHTVYEAHLRNGSAGSEDPSMLGVSSSFTVLAPDGLKEEITIGFTQPDGTTDSITLSKSELSTLSDSAPKTISTPYGELKLTGYTLNSATNTATVNYSYTLTHAPTIEGKNTTDVFTVTGADNKTGANNPNKTGTGTITITIVDDAPTAVADSNSIVEDATSPATGNVLNNDTAGADGWVTTGSGSDAKNSTVVGVEKGTPPHAPSTGIGQGVPGKYGTLTLEADGSYSYVLDNSNLAVQGLLADETLTETYTYTIADKDGDTTKTTLTITIIGQNDGVKVTGPDTSVVPSNPQADGNTHDHVVFESGLSHGSSPNAHDIQVESSFTIKALDGVGLVEVGVNEGNSIRLNKTQLEALGTSHQSFTTHFGTMELNGYAQATDGTITVNYTYTLTSAPQNASASDNLVKETFTVTATDRDSIEPDSDSDEFTVTIVDDAPKAEDDAATLDRKMTVANGNVIGAGGTTAPGLGDAADSQGADGSTLSSISVGGVKEYSTISNAYDKVVARDYTVTINGDDYGPSAQLPETIEPGSDGKITITDKFGKLIIAQDGSYTYTALNNRDNALGIERSYTYTIIDKDGDSSPATLTIYVETRSPIITDSGVPVPKDHGLLTPHGQVNEAGLADGSSDDKTIASTTGVITFTPGDGQSEITLATADGKTLHIQGAFTTGTQTLETPYGTVTVTSYDPVKGKLEYTYTLTHPVAGSDTTPHEDAFTVTVDGMYANEPDADRTVSATINIAIIDDVPLAEPDRNTIAADAPPESPAIGNVLVGTPHSSGDQTDKKGADAATLTVVGVQPGTLPLGEHVPSTSSTQFTGLYGNLELSTNGSYIYTVDRSNVQVLGLIGDETLTETFTYTIQDGDGSLSTTTLTITITAADDPVTITPPPSATDTTTKPDTNTLDLVVFESGLPTGSDTNTSHTTVNSTLELSVPDGLADTDAITLTYTDRDGHPATLTLTRTEVEALGSTSHTVTTENGTLTFDGYEKGTNGVITLDYTYTLQVPSTTPGDDTRDPFTVTVRDRDGDTDDVTVSIKIVDDAPDAADDSNTTFVNVPVTGHLAENDTHGADGITTWVVKDEPTHGMVSVDPHTGIYTYTPPPGFVGTDTFTYTVTDNDGDTSTATVTITVLNTPPVAQDDRHVTEPGGDAVGNLITGGSAGDQPDSDADGHTITVTQITVEGQTYDIPPGGHVLILIPEKGALKVDSEGNYTFVPVPMFGGEVPEVGYTISDGYDTNTAVLRITSTPAPLNVDTYVPFMGIPPTFGASESPLNGAVGETPWKGDAMRDPSVFWEGINDNRALRLPLLLHPVVYVNNAVVQSQQQAEMNELLSNWSNWYHDEAQLASFSTHLGMDPSLFVHFAVRAAQQERRFWEFLASNIKPNLDVTPPAPQTMPSSLNTAPPVAGDAPQAPSTAAATTEAEANTETSNAEVFSHWQVAATASAEGQIAAQSSAAASASFRTQLLAQASELPSHALQP